MLFRLPIALRKWYTWPQWLASFDVFLISFMVGFQNGWASPILAKLRSANSTLPITDSEASWIASLLNAGRAFGSIGGLFCAEYFGSKTSLVQNAFIHGIGMACLLYVTSVNWLYASRFIVGFGSGMWQTIFPIYVGEISNPKIRGALVSFITLGMPIGYMIGNIVGAHTTMWASGCFGIAIIAMFLLLFFWFPHSPYHLAMHDQIDKALASITWYQRDADAVIELVSIKEYVEEKRWLKLTDYFNEMLRDVNRIALFKVTMIHLLLQFAGFCTLGYYMEIILTTAQINFMNPADVVSAIAGGGLIGGLISIYTCDKCGRKVSMGGGALGFAFGLIGVGIYFHLIYLGIPVAETFQWVPVLMIIILEFAINIGIDPVVGTIFSEMFAPSIKITASSLINFFSSVFAFISTQWYQSLVDAVEIHYAFYFFSTSAALLAVFSFLFLPETKGKSLQEIQKMLRNK
ncbi:facilitated trehalose transporter Tret1-like [Chelonus insularis]|uniref:facilitated trehalose transporter Tret1-like n=1 Tax=Chelonus insularis TaxID=460826 RepID=UPI00158AAA4E|nr:facilitated trehalose transporter Tret1-like [Chelonus insularis]